MVNNVGEIFLRNFARSLISLITSCNRKRLSYSSLILISIVTLFSIVLYFSKYLLFHRIRIIFVAFVRQDLNDDFSDYYGYCFPSWKIVHDSEKYVLFSQGAIFQSGRQTMYREFFRVKLALFCFVIFGTWRIRDHLQNKINRGVYWVNDLANDCNFVDLKAVHYRNILAQFFWFWHFARFNNDCFWK